MIKATRSIFLVWCYLFIGANVFTIFSNPPGINADPRYSFEAMMEEKAARPFIYRALVPQVTRWLSAIVPDSVFAFYEKYRWQDWLQQERYRTRTPSELTKEWILYCWLATVCFAATGWTLQAILPRFYPDSAAQAHLWGLVGLCFLPLLFDFHGQMYDPASVLLFSLTFLAMIARNKVWYYVLFALAVFNKETSILLIGFYVIYTWDQRRWLDWAAQLGIYAAITACLRWQYGQHSGGIVEMQLWNNLRFMITPSLVLGAFWMKLMVLVAAVSLGWKQRPVLLRRCLILALVVLVPLWAAWGRIAEVRGFLECYFLLFLLAYPNLDRLFCKRTA